MWSPNTSALVLLETHGSPFGTNAFRQAVVDTAGEWCDVSFGAIAADGALAAVPLLARARGAESLPPSAYGGVVASRALDASETLSFLKLAWRELRLRSLRIRSLELGESPAVGRRFATASVVPVDRTDPPAVRYSRLARRSVSRAANAGATVAATDSADAFWSVYSDASSGWMMRYPEPLVRRLIDTGTARVDAVSLGGRVVASLLTLVTGSHWMCWLAGQTAEGRSIAASYLAYDALFAEAQASGIRAVNLGASTAGGAEFKRHLGAEEVGMHEWTRETPTKAAVRQARGVVVAAVSVAKRARRKIG